MNKSCRANKQTSHSHGDQSNKCKPSFTVILVTNLKDGITSERKYFKTGLFTHSRAIRLSALELVWELVGSRNFSSVALMEPNFQLRFRSSGSLEPFPYIHFHQKILLLLYYNPALGARAGNGSRGPENRLPQSWYTARTVQTALAIVRMRPGS